MPVPDSYWAPPSNVLAVEHNEVSTGLKATVTSPVGSLAVIIAARQVIAAVPPPPPTIPTALMEAYEALLGTCRSVSVVEPKGLVEALRAAQALVRRSPC